MESSRWQRIASLPEAAFESYIACRPAGSAGGYALAVNVQRRSLSKGQKAMLIARFAEYKNYTREDADTAGVSKQYVSWAKTVLTHAPDQVSAVISGAVSLDEAYRVARQNKASADSEGAQRDALRRLAPDLAVLVDNDIRDLADALREAENRKIVHCIDALRDADGAPPPSFAQRAEDDSVTWEEAKTLAEQWQVEWNESVRRDQDRLRSVISCWGAIRTVKNSTTPYVEAVIDGLGENDRDQLDQILSEVKK